MLRGVNTPSAGKTSSVAKVAGVSIRLKFPCVSFPVIKDRVDVLPVDVLSEMSPVSIRRYPFFMGDSKALLGVKDRDLGESANMPGMSTTGVVFGGAKPVKRSAERGVPWGDFDLANISSLFLLHTMGDFISSRKTRALPLGKSKLGLPGLDNERRLLGELLILAAIYY